MGDGKISFFMLDIILLVVFTGLIYMIFNLKRIPFAIELFVLIVLMLLAFIALIGVYNKANWGFVLLAAVFILIMGDMALFYLMENVGNNFFIMTALSGLGFFISIVGIEKKRQYHKRPEVSTTFDPGKYVASKTGASYHAPTCEWAAKIKEKNRVWFDDEKEAKKKYKPHGCLK